MRRRKELMRDMIVVLPGMTGSVLEKDNTPIWAPLPEAVIPYIRTLGKSLDALRLEYDDPDCEDLGDGIRATRLVPYQFDREKGVTSLCQTGKKKSSKSLSSFKTCLF